MALIKCADCGGDVATSAAYCLRCGSKEFDPAKNVEKKVSDTETKIITGIAKKIGWWGCVLGAVVGAAAIQIAPPATNIGARIGAALGAGLFGALTVGAVAWVIGALIGAYKAEKMGNKK
jgi:hypothetical protein